MPTNPPTISPAPVAPQRGDRTTFSARVDAFLNWLVGAVAQFGAVATNAYNNAVEASTSATSAGASASTATTKAGEAAASASSAAAYLAALPDGSINDALDDLTHTYSASKLLATFGRLAVGNIWTAGNTFQSSIAETPVVANTGTAYTITDRSFHALTLTGNCTFTFPAAAAGKQFSILLKQDATGSRTITWPSAVRWPGGTAPAITATASKSDIVSFISDGSYWLGCVGPQNYTRA
jgi:hypothetical protein